jgi:hypothetical protein
VRTLYEIIEMVKSNQNPEYEELFYTVLVYNALHYQDHRRVRELDKNKPEWMFENEKSYSFNDYKKALNMSPKEWIGCRDDPKNPDCQKMKKIANRLFDKIQKDLDL